MNVIMNTTHVNILDVFNSIFYEDIEKRYSQKGFQCYKLYIYMYYFGCVRERDLPYIFADEEILHEKSALELKNAFRSRITHWVKTKELEKADKDGFILTGIGLKKLYEYLNDKYSMLFKDISYEDFKKAYSPRNNNISHASNTGLTVLMLAKMIESVFWYEPMLDYAGNMMTGDFYKYRDCMLIPDAVIVTGLDEKIYVEADNCTERKTTSLLPKCSKYSNIMRESNEERVKSTIHFSVQHNYEKGLFESEYYKAKDICDLYKFVRKDVGCEISFDKWITFLQGYTGKFEPAIRCSQILENVDGSEHVDSVRKLVYLLKRAALYDVFDKYFLKRQKYIFEAIAFNKELCDYALDGVRLVCLPMLASEYLQKCIYIEYVENEKIARFLSKKLGFKISKIIYRLDKKKFGDKYTGDEFIFKHSFQITNGETGEKCYVVIENISDDYGGRLRVKNYIRLCRELEDKVRIICLYNKVGTENPLSLFPYGASRFEKNNVYFADYDEFIK